MYTTFSSHADHLVGIQRDNF